MEYAPNPNRQIKNGKAVVSAEELADFKAKFGADKTLRDLLNEDKGLQRKLVIPKSMRNLPDSYPDPRDDEGEMSRGYRKADPAYERPARPPATETRYTQRMAKGGSASSRADGIAQRGKTKGTMVMCGGGMSKR